MRLAAGFLSEEIIGTVTPERLTSSIPSLSLPTPQLVQILPSRSCSSVAVLPGLLPQGWNKGSRLRGGLEIVRSTCGKNANVYPIELVSRRSYGAVEGGLIHVCRSICRRFADTARAIEQSRRTSPSPSPSLIPSSIR